ncbi:hypothetical protein KKF61_07005 [Patescibacteria group bacterium]|nr:hypothetical protein [Patescibacteria group bacterium]
MSPIRPIPALTAAHSWIGGLCSMAKINDPTKILGAGATPSPGAGPGFLGQARSTIKEFQELLKLAKELQGLAGGQQADQAPAREIVTVVEPGPAPAKAEPQSPAGGIAAFAQFMIKSGYGDVPVEDILKEVGPYTIKQLLALAQGAQAIQEKKKNARPEK